MYVNPSGSAPALHIANADGSQDALYALSVRSIESWSPDGSRFLFTAGESGQMMVGQMGQNPVPLADNETVVKTVWADTHTVLYIHPGSAGYELRLGQVGGQSLVIDTLQSDREIWLPVMDVHP